MDKGANQSKAIPLHGGSHFSQPARSWRALHKVLAEMVQSQPQRLKANVPGAGRPDPPPDMPEDEAEIWRSVVDSMPSGWFGGQTHGVLSLYCYHMALAQGAITQVRFIKTRLTKTRAGRVDAGDVDMLKQLETIARRESTQAASLASRLRITPVGEKVNKGHIRAAVENTPRTRPWED